MHTQKKKERKVFEKEFQALLAKTPVFGLKSISSIIMEKMQCCKDREVSDLPTICSASQKGDDDYCYGYWHCYFVEKLVTTNALTTFQTTCIQVG